MNGEHTVDELCASLDEKRRQTAVGLIRTLLGRGFARHSPEPRDDVLPPSVGAAFAAQIRFVEHFMHDDARTPQELFARFRASRVLVAGPPEPVAAAAVRGLLRNGLAEVTVEDTAWKPHAEEELARLEAAGVPAALVTLPDAAQCPDEFDVVLCAADIGDTRSLLRLTERLTADAAGQTRLLPVLTGGGRAVIGPFSGDPGQPCWLCAQLRVAAAVGPALAAEVWRGVAGAGVPGGGLSDITREMLGNTLAFDVFRLRTGQLQPDDERHAVVQDLTTLESQRHRVLPHPGCPLPHRPAAPLDTASAPAVPGEDSDAYGRVSALVHPTLGLLTRFSDEEIRQIPLKTGRVRLAPAARMTDAPREISAYDIETVLVARTRAALAAVTAHAGRLGARRPADDPAGRTTTGREVPATALETHSGAVDEPSRRASRLLSPATDLRDGSAWLVPAAAVRPLSPDNEDRLFTPTAAGAAAGWSEPEVRERGLASALGHRGLLWALRGTAPAREYPQETLTADEDIAFALRSLRHIGADARVFALPGAAPVHAVLAVVDNPGDALPDWSVGHALDPLDALRTAVRDAAGLAVSRHVDGVAADPGDRLLADLDPRALGLDGRAAALAEQAPTTVDEVLGALHEDGTRALFTDTTPLDLASLHGLRTGTVLLAAT